MRITALKRTTLALCTTILIYGCRDEDPGPHPTTAPPPADTGGETATEGCVGEHCLPMTTGGVADTTGGDPGAEECSEYSRYTCRGWHAGIYKNGALLRFDFSTVPPDGDNWSRCRKFDICIPSLGEPDSDALFDACAAQDAMSPPSYPAHPFSGGTSASWNFDHVAYVFADSGPSAIPGVTGSVDCAWTGAEPQVLYRECLPEAECPALAQQSCVGWAPSTKITSSLNSMTKVYTVTINKVWFDALMLDMMDSYFKCDQGGWYWDAALSKWRMKYVGTGDLVQVMGFRTGDEQLRVKSGGTSTWYTLYGASEAAGYAAGLNAYAAIFGATSYTFDFKRSGVTYTMNVTLI